MKSAGAFIIMLALGIACSREGMGPELPQTEYSSGNSELNPTVPDVLVPGSTEDLVPDPSSDMPVNDPIAQKPTPDNPKPTVPDPVEPIPMEPIPDPCLGKKLKTSLTPKVANFKSSGVSQTLVYEIELKNCEGIAQEITSQVISFDDNYPVSWSGINYEVFDSTGLNNLGSGAFTKKSGVDIYGQPKNNWFIRQTASITMPAKTMKIVLKLKIPAFTPPSTTPASIWNAISLNQVEAAEITLPTVK